MKDFLKTFLIVLLIAVATVITLYFAVPEVKAAVNEHIFHIEQTVEDETPDNEEETPNDGTEEGTGENDNPIDGMPDPEDDRLQESTEE